MQNHQSSDIRELLTALMNGHQEFGVVIPKDKEGVNAMYASLPKILSFIHKLCSKNGLILRQAPRIIEGKSAIETILSHPSSGQWLSGFSFLPTDDKAKNINWAEGSASTYRRRYDAMTLCGLFAEDDPSDNDGNNESDQKIISQKQLGLLNYKINNRSDLEKKILEHLKIERLSDVPSSRFSGLLDYISKYQGT